jgi:hypothetical protein
MHTSLKIAMEEAERFLRAARKIKTDTRFDSIDASKESGAVRRASMDLTRALAELRSGRYP